VIQQAVSQSYEEDDVDRSTFYAWLILSIMINVGFFIYGAMLAHTSETELREIMGIEGEQAYRERAIEQTCNESSVSPKHAAE
jgi:hypothetical protein